MSDSRTFVLVLLLAALVPVVLLAVVRLAVWAVPPSHRWIVGFELRHRFAVGLVEAAVWMLWFAWSFTVEDPWINNWFLRGMNAVFALEAITRAVRHRRGQEDWFASFLKKRYSSE